MSLVFPSFSVHSYGVRGEVTKAKGGKKKRISKGEGRGEKGGEQTAENPILENALTDTRARLPQAPGTPRRHGRSGETASGATGHPGQELRAAAAAGGPASLSVNCSHGPGGRSRHGTGLLPCPEASGDYSARAHTTDQRVLLLPRGCELREHAPCTGVSCSLQHRDDVAALTRHTREGSGVALTM